MPRCHPPFPVFILPKLVLNEYHMWLRLESEGAEWFSPSSCGCAGLACSHTALPPVFSGCCPWGGPRHLDLATAPFPRKQVLPSQCCQSDLLAQPTGPCSQSYWRRWCHKIISKMFRTYGQVLAGTLFLVAISWLVKINTHYLNALFFWPSHLDNG